MCTGVELALLAGAGSAVASAAMAKTPAMPAASTPEKPPQASKSPDVNTYKKANAAAAATGPMAGPSSTWLTGPSGVDSSLLNLGKSTLLGS